MTGPRVHRVRWRPFRIPLTDAFRAAHGTLDCREGFVVTVEDGDGCVGLGEASPLASFVRIGAADVAPALEALAPLSIGDPLREIRPLQKYAPPPTGPDIYGMALLAAHEAIEMAAVDCDARHQGLPLFHLLDDKPPGSRCVPVNGVIGGVTAGDASAEAARLAAAGFGTIKVKVGLGREEDLARVEAVRAAAPDAILRIDANGAWTEEQAIEELRGLSRFGIDLVEQPVAPGPGDWEAMHRLRAATGLRIAADESAVRFGESLKASVGRAVEGGGWAEFVDAMVVKPLVVGPVGATIFCDGMIEGIVTTTFDTGIGTAFAMHLAATLPEPRPACGLDTLRFLAGDIVTGVPVISGGEVMVPDRPGLGVELDLDALERWATGPWREVG